MNRSEFIKKTPHSFDYSKVPQVFTVKEKLTIICKKHGAFEQSAEVHIKSKYGCPNCAKHLMQLYTWEQFLAKAHKGFNFSEPQSFNYSETRLEIRCPAGHVFYMTGKNHVFSKKGGCKECQYTNNASNRKIPLEQVQQELTNAFPDKNYTVVKDKFTMSSDQIVIKCPKHGEYKTYGRNFKHGHGSCKNCSTPSNLEKVVSKLLSDNNFNFRKNDRKAIKPLEIDFYLPKEKVGIEVGGLYWHSSAIVNKEYHIRKYLEAQKNGVNLLQFFEDEVISKKEIVESMILNKLGKSKKIWARKCRIIKVPTNTKTAFLQANHIQGACGSQYDIGLEYNGELVSIMTFSKPRLNMGRPDYDFELLRFCNKVGYTVVGGASRLFKHFLSVKNPDTVLSYSNNRYSCGNLYNALGFTFSHMTKPNYTYYKSGVGNVRHNRFAFRKSELKKKLTKYDKNLSEAENMENNGYLRIYDGGNKAWVYSKSK